MKTIWKELLLVIIGSLIFALGVNVFALPNQLGEGGVTGISMLLYYVFHWSPSYTNFAMNAVLLLIGYKLLHKRVTLYTTICIVCTSLFLHITEGMSVPVTDPLLGAIFAGIFIGIGLGLVLRSGGTTGGSTILARMANQYFGFGISSTMLIIDLIVVLSSYFVIGAQNTMYTVISLYISSKVLDYIIDGFDARKAVTIISMEPQAIAKRVNAEMDRGVTVFSAQGNYSKETKEILYVVINKQELFQLKKIVHKQDDQAFVVIHDVRDVFGEGFTFPKKEIV
ncbi:YxkD-like protein [Fictibacillus macauensis ZFHKF-1]|uniref:YxkD-like protein n=1 Tax=Fictibacillus macauensis ZFHKF-1 TaxID=1196324 RepID=I8UFC8_9BACL|nr:YitT family protein [Fictibacillus macauensis]EIT85600.1 YxkD-like protein [Fictibacillus macauensis ZFHKF-1]